MSELNLDYDEQSNQINTIEDLQRLFESKSVDLVYIKKLSPKQDNDKNQIYFGSGLKSLSNLFSGDIIERSEPVSSKKKSDLYGDIGLQLYLKWYWMDRNGNTARANGTKAIEYPQYPEVRLSGFLSGCPLAPQSLRRTKQSRFKTRYLCFGFTPELDTVGIVLTEVEDELARNFPDLPKYSESSLLSVLIVNDQYQSTPGDILLNLLKTKVGSEKHSGFILKPDGPVPFNGNQSAGYTLEGLLGIVANGKSGPDILGYELKTTGSSNGTLITTEPDLGEKADLEFKEYMSRYGSPGKKDSNTIRFTGTFSLDKKPVGKDYILRLFRDGEKDGLPGHIGLYSLDEKILVQGWSFQKLNSKWVEKHSNAVYIKYSKEKDESRNDVIQFGPICWFAHGTSFNNFLEGIRAGVIYFDPADSIYENGQSKSRAQWRYRISQRDEVYSTIYNNVEKIELY